MKIIVKSEQVINETTAKGNPITKQQAALVNGDMFPLPFFLTPEGGRPYPIGEYDLDPACFVTTPWQTLDIDPYRIRLIPRKNVKAA